MTSFRVLLRIYGFHDFRGTKSVNVCPDKSAENVTVLPTAGITVGRKVVKYSAKVLLLDECHCVDEMRQMQVERVLRRT